MWWWCCMCVVWWCCMCVVWCVGEGQGRRCWAAWLTRSRGDAIASFQPRGACGGKRRRQAWTNALTHPQPLHCAVPLPMTMNFSAARRRSASAFLRATSLSGFCFGRERMCAEKEQGRVVVGVRARACAFCVRVSSVRAGAAASDAYAAAAALLLLLMLPPLRSPSAAVRSSLTSSSWPRVVEGSSARTRTLRRCRGGSGGGRIDAGQDGCV